MAFFNKSQGLPSSARLFEPGYSAISQNDRMSGKKPPGCHRNEILFNVEIKTSSRDERNDGPGHYENNGIHAEPWCDKSHHHIHASKSECCQSRHGKLALEQAPHLSNDSKRTSAAKEYSWRVSPQSRRARWISSRRVRPAIYRGSFSRPHRRCLHRRRFPRTAHSSNRRTRRRP